MTPMALNVSTKAFMWQILSSYEPSYRMAMMQCSEPMVPVNKGPRVDVDYILIRRESVGSTSDRCQPEGLCCLR